MSPQPTTNNPRHAKTHPSPTAFITHLLTTYPHSRISLILCLPSETATTPFLRLPRTLQTISAARNIFVAFAPTPSLFRATVASLQDKGQREEEVGILAVWGLVRAHWTAGSAEWWAGGIGRGIAAVVEIAGCGWVFGEGIVEEEEEEEEEGGVGGSGRGENGDGGEEGEEWWGAEVPVLVGGDRSTDVAGVFRKWCFVERRERGREGRVGGG